jgi:hypothetical protein
MELVSLPVPWTIVSSGREATLEVGMRQVHSPKTFCATAIACDADLGALLGYLSSGSLPTVVGMIETATDALYDKTVNPFAAAAGGYALVGAALTSEDEKWHGWIRNLMDLFPAIPDGAIQWAQLRLRTRRHETDRKEASQALKEAYHRGIPFFSMGMKWLMEGLEMLAPEDPEADQMLGMVRELAWRTNYQQPFTILRIAGKQRV